jgi:hypothetical protein
MKKVNLLSHSKFTKGFSEICYIFITIFVIRTGNSRFTGTYALTTGVARQGRQGGVGVGGDE